ncbi:MAG: hypothetical protein LQ340_005475, partial [Diploschistes diacapsis]
MLIIGLTGSIATGKSTAAALLSSPPHRLPLIDADVIARAVVAPGTRAYGQIVAHFGPLAPDLLLLPPPPSASRPAASPSSSSPPSSSARPLNRAALSRLVFGSSPRQAANREKLNGIVHPAVRRALARDVLAAYARGHWAVVVDVPLLFEAGLDLFAGAVIVVAVRDRELQIRRLMRRDAEREG